MELDSSAYKVNSLKDNKSADFITLKSNYADMKRVAGVISAEARKYEKLETDFSGKVRGGHANSEQGHNRVRGGAHCRVRESKSQRKINASRSESAQRSSTKNNDRFGHLSAWKGRDRDNLYLYLPEKQCYAESMDLRMKLVL
ncbi:hypothetical protein RND71_025823 [Anisodus tanguticus]|uniref:Uncharacterized protein n=1 Tax=Anisodus tanguticus TaxID=243964 RepID=A0AAE1RM28_9SOLA|nr:hypothetical protein RND71_025823 [Anisodus tanguticus]